MQTKAKHPQFLIFFCTAKKGPSGDLNSELQRQTAQVDKVILPVLSPGLPENSRRSQRISTRPAAVYNHDGADTVVPEVPEAASTPELEAASSAEPAADSTPEPAADSTSGTTYAVPEWLRQRHHHPLRTYVIKHMFSNQLCHKLARKYRLAVYSHCDGGCDVQSQAVMALLSHELDHKDTTPFLEHTKLYFITTLGT